jgi:heat shock protein HtpX
MKGKEETMKRIVLFLFTNLAVILILSIVLNILGVDRILDAQVIGLDMANLLVFAVVFGFGGSFISLVMWKWTAKRITGARVISTPRDLDEAWLVNAVKRQVERSESRVGQTG